VVSKGRSTSPPESSAEPAGLALFAPCPRGLEAWLREEIERLGGTECSTKGGGVAFRGTTTTAMRVNLHSRIASRVLMQVAHGRYRDEDGLYRLARQTPWESWFDERVTLRVDVSAHRSPLRSLNFAALRVKDALCDRFRDATGIRPSVDTREPDIRIFAFLDPAQVTLYLDLSGPSLFKRGWRANDDAAGAAPLKENLAAGLLALAGWRPGHPLHDPFCGSGTLLIEAAQQTLNIAPGLERHFGFERLQGFDAIALANLRQEALQSSAAALAQLERNGGVLPITGADIDPQAIRRARHNLKRAGIPADAVHLGVANFGAPNTRAPDVAMPSGDLPDASLVKWVITNPPYGERISAQDHEPEGFTGEPIRRGAHKWPPKWPPKELPPEPRAEPSNSAHARAMSAAGDTLRRAFGGWRACLFSPDLELPRQLGMQPRRKTPLFNGAIECRLFCFDIFDRTRS
jgi:putative N6-adenine-specific DNA methylase